MIGYNDNYFDTHQTHDCFLSGQVDLAGFSFAVTDGKGGCHVLKYLTCQRAILSYDDWAKELGVLFEQEPLLRKTYQSSTWTFLSHKATLLPTELLDKNHLRTCLGYTAALDDLDEIHHHALPAYNAVSVYTVPSPPANTIFQYQPKTRFRHQQVQLLSQLYYLSGANRMLLHLSPGLTDIVLYVEHQLVMCHTYKTDTFADTFYYLMLALKTHHLQADTTLLYYIGNLSDCDYNLLCRYFKKIQNIYHSTTRGLLGEKTATTYHTLFTLPQCE